MRKTRAKLRDPEDPIGKFLEGDKPVLVVGFGRSGRSAAELLADVGCRVVVSELMDREDFTDMPGKLHPGIDIRWGGHPLDLAEGHGLVVLSPGVPMDSEFVRRAVKCGATVIGEMELAYRLSRSPWVAITGTNGKSTTTTLLGEFARVGKIPSAVGGNLGTPVTEMILREGGISWFIVEVSSFQLETVERFHPAVGVLLNISPDHLDRYAGEGDYIEAKANIFRNMEEEDWAVVNADDPAVMRMAQNIRPRLFPFSRKKNLKQGVVFTSGWIVIRDGEKEIRVIHSGEIRLVGKHNLENCLAAVAAGWKMGIQPSSMARAMETFPGLEHRMEPVAFFRGVPIYNDSKGTNVGATMRSLEGLHSDVILIMGGKDKGTSFDPLRGPISRKVSRLILIGESGERMRDALEDTAPIFMAGNLNEAVKEAIDWARPGNEILFSPASSSFDMFNSFEERGKIFKKLVGRYIGGAE
ncbi:UDP-N-acetylmuramoylalanine--D-glutamate ligase [bacterium BMS3Abin14]|nr:UDP-N-acetylmuramoylalanine--D-glutamate ligase [bacterium BMS3Abin14]